MIARTWSLSGLATELNLDRRTLARQLTGLAPDEEAQVGKRTERRWLLARVVEHLGNPDGETLDLNEERAKLARVQRLKAEFELGELEGSLIREELVLRQWQAIMLAIRARLLALPSRLAVACATPDRFQEAFLAAQTLIYEALDAIADGEEIHREVDAHDAELERSARASSEE